MKFPTVITLAVLAAAPASAVTYDFDFADLAETEKAARGREVGFDVAMPGGWTLGGITVNATTQPGSYPFLDGPWARGVSAGLGACEIDDCNGHWRDGFDSGEQITLTFSERVRITDVSFRESSFDHVNGDADDHTLYSGGMYVNGAGHSVSDGVLATPLFGTAFTFSPFADASPAGGEVSPYLSAVSVEPAPVPLPAAAWLLLGGVGLLAGIGRRKPA